MVEYEKDLFLLLLFFPLKNSGENVFNICLKMVFAFVLNLFFVIKQTEIKRRRRKKNEIW